MPDKALLILLDGLGDRSYSELDQRTPLQAARTPFLDQLARHSATGFYHAGRLGQALPSENAHFALFGYPPEDFPGRGPLEALGAGIDLAPDEVALLVHLVSVHAATDTLVLDEDDPDLAPDEAAEFIAAVDHFTADDVQLRFVPTKGGFGVLILRGDVSPYVTDSNLMRAGLPLPDLRPWHPWRDDPTSRRTAAVLRSYHRWAFQRLSQHPRNRQRQASGQAPVNGLVTQRAGRLKPVVPFRQQNGLRGLSIAAGLIYWGLARYLGLDLQQARDTDQPGADLAERLRLARAALERYDFIHLHTKAPDVAAHAKDPRRKMRVIEELDGALAAECAPLLDDPNLLLVVTADHSTPSGGALIHSGEPVPLLFHGRGVRVDQVTAFDEVSAAGGALGCVRDREIMYLILNHLERAKLRGTMDAPHDQPNWPGDYHPLRLQEDDA